MASVGAYRIVDGPDLFSLSTALFDRTIDHKNGQRTVNITLERADGDRTCFAFTVNEAVRNKGGHNSWIIGGLVRLEGGKNLCDFAKGISAEIQEQPFYRAYYDSADRRGWLNFSKEPLVLVDNPIFN